MSQDKKPAPRNQTSRRDFMRTSSILVAGSAVGGSLNIARAAHSFGSDEIKIGVVGCGGRGSAATAQALNTMRKTDINPNGQVKLVAMADAFGSQLQQGYRIVKSAHPDIEVPQDGRFVGFDAYERLLETDVDLVILATPPGFRPLHFEKAIEAGKHVFMEKPVATDAVGVRRVLAANEVAKSKGLAVAVGLQRHHEPRYIETIKRIRDGAIGDIVTTRVYWNGAGVWVRPRRENETELNYQMRNWYYFNWLCGDHITEQHIHNLDVSNWLLDAHPVECNGMGGREVRTGPDHGQIFDHHFCEFTYANGVKMFSQCRHIKGCWNNVSEHAHGTKGHADLSGKIWDAKGDLMWQYGKNNDERGWQLEHYDLFAAIRKGEIPNEGDYGAKSTMTSILGREATYTGKPVKWDEAIESSVGLADFDSLREFDQEAPVQPDVNGKYPVPIPGEQA